MKVLFDTNILVAAMIEIYPNYGISFPWVQKVRNSQIYGYVSTHSLAELYSVLTRLLLPKPLSAQQACHGEHPIFAIEKHRKLGESISIWEDGKVVTIQSDKIPPLEKDV